MPRRLPPPRRTRPSGSPAALLLALLPAVLPLLLLAGCAEDGEAGRALTRGDGSEARTPEPLRGREYTRGFVFLSTEQDTALAIPFTFRSVAGEREVVRTLRGGLARRGTWETFAEDRWETPPTRYPWRLHPRSSVRLLVGGSDSLEGILFRETGRGLELGLGEPLAEWGGAPDETFRVLRGEVLLSGGSVPGVVLDVSQAGEAGGGAGSGLGDVGFLVSGDSVLIVLDEGAREPAEGAAGDPDPDPQTFAAWVRLPGGEERTLEPLRVEWLRRRAFEEARRDVPVEWRISGAGEPSVRGRLDARGSDLVAGRGEGPRLPLEAHFQVEGTVIVGDRSYPVHGYLRHVRP